MQHLPQIKAAYDWFYVHWQHEASQAAAASDRHALTKLEEKRDVLERGTFVLMFGQFEVAVNETFNATRSQRANNPDWTYRRGWDADVLRGRRVPFDTKLSMILDKRSTFFAKIITTYATRNHCAHGGTTAPVGSIDSLEADLYVWAAQLKS